jgi:formylglycine-generating enzyme required for sulfatase activity
MSLEGRQLGEFEILEKLGQGGMGAVYKATQTSLDRIVALKTLQSSLGGDADYIARFRQEAKAAASLNHSNLVQVISAGESEGVHWFAMEFVEGESAQARLKRKGRLKPLEAIAIAIHVATALDYGWRKAALIHRDIKPDNIFLSGDGEVKLGDLGLAKSAGQAPGLTSTGAIMGTPYYISPEQAEGRREVDLRSDIYSLGCTLYHLLCGQPPYIGNSAVAVMMKHVSAPVPDPRRVWPECPKGLAAVLEKMMQKQAADRQQSYSEVIAELRLAYELLSGARVPSVVAVTQKPTVGKKKRGAPAAAWLAAAGLCVAFGALVYLAPWKKGDAGPPAAAGLPAMAGAAIPSRGDTRLALQTTAAIPSRPLGTTPATNPITATKDAPFVNSLGMKFVPAPITGGPTAGQQVLFSVWDTRVQDYEAFVKETDRDWPRPDFEQGPTHPAVMVSWEDAQLFCQWLTRREQAAGRLPAEWRYRLPSDHEWSCAVELGAKEDAAKLPSEKSEKITDVFPWGTQWPPPAGAGKYSNINGVIADYNDGYVNTSPVGSFAANRLGLFDMGGNVQQWCEDWFDKEQKHRVLRGASWHDADRGLLRSAIRLQGTPGYRNYVNGFRCVLAAAVPTPPTGPVPALAASGAVLQPLPPPTPAPSATPKPPTEVEKWFAQVDGPQQEAFRKQVLKPFETGVADLRARYLAALDADIAKASAAGRLADALVWRTERQAFEKAQNVAKDNADTPAGVKTLRASFRQQLAKLDQDRIARARALLGQYDAILAKNQTLLTQRQHFDDALLLKGKRDEIALAWLGPSPIIDMGATGAQESAKPPGDAGPITATKAAPFGNTLGMQFVPVPILGGPTAGQRVLFSVWDTRVQDYEAFVKDTQRGWPKPDFEQGPTHPAVQVSWDDAQLFCEWLTRREKAAGRLPAGCSYRLPSDHEWSCAAGIERLEEAEESPASKSGKIQVYPWGTQWPPPKGAGNYDPALQVDKFQKTSPVGSFAANQKGLYDMGGNVWQWCEDWNNPEHKYRVLRGASWNNLGEIGMRSTFREEAHPADRCDFHGFRCVLVVTGG